MISVATKIKHEITIPGYDETVVVEVTIPRPIANKFNTVNLNDELSRIGVVYIGKLIQNLPQDQSK